MKTAYKVFSIITNVITWSVVACVLFAVCTLFVPKLFGTEPYIVMSGSMEPVIHTGSLVYINKTDEKADIGDIIAYNATDEVAVVHRVIRYGVDGYITKGDANEFADMNEIKSEQVIGKFVRTVPKAGYLLATIRSNIIYVGQISMPAMVPIAAGVVMLLNVIQYVLGAVIPDDIEKK